MNVRRWMSALFAVWFFVGAGLDLSGRSFGTGWGDFVFIALAAGLVWLAWREAIGRRRAALAFLWVTVVSGIIEYIGATQGVPFGAYSYSDRLGPRVFGVLPLAIPLAWWLVIGAAFAIAGSRLGRLGRTGLMLSTAVTPVAAVLVDLVLEPAAFHSRHYWWWRDGGVYYGVPVSNFWSWGLLSLLLAAGLALIAGPVWPVRWSRPSVRITVSTALAGALALFVLAECLAGLWPPAVLGAALLAGLGWFGLRG